MAVRSRIPVIGKSSPFAEQTMRLVAPEVAFKLTAFAQREETFVVHARRLLQHTSLKAVLWVNITQRQVQFTTIE